MNVRRITWPLTVVILTGLLIEASRIIAMNEATLRGSASQRSSCYGH